MSSGLYHMLYWFLLIFKVHEAFPNVFLNFYILALALVLLLNQNVRSAL